MIVAIEVAACLALIYALGALVCSVAHEWIAQIFRLRWKNLQRALVDLLGSDDLSKVMSHPLLQHVWDSSRHPTAIPTAVFARALVNAFAPVGDTSKGTQASVAVCTDAQQLLQTLPIGLQRQIVPFIAGTKAEIDDLYRAAETWFDQSMSAASDWYARQSHWLSILIAVVFAVACNIDSIAIGTALQQEPEQRAALMLIAEKTVDQYKNDPNSICPAQASLTDRQSAVAGCFATLHAAGGNLIGWNAAVWQRVQSFSSLALAALGWLVSGMAMSLGAHFWFDALSRIITVRAGLDPDSVKATAQKSA